MLDALKGVMPRKTLGVRMIAACGLIAVVIVPIAVLGRDLMCDRE